MNQDWLKLGQVKGFEVAPENESDGYYFRRYRRDTWLKIFYVVNDAGLSNEFDQDIRSKFEKGELA